MTRSPTNRSRRVLAIGIVSLLAATFWHEAPVRADKFGPVTINQIPLYETHEATRRGYAGYLFQVKNTSKDDHRVRIEWPGSGVVGFGGNHLVNNRRSVKVGAGQTAHLWLYQPPIATWGGGAAIYIDGSRHKDVLYVEAHHQALDDNEAVSTTVTSVPGGLYSSSTPYSASSTPSAGMGIGGAAMPYSFTNNTAVVLVSRGLSGEFRDDLTKKMRDCHIVRSVQPPAQWPTNWIVYSQFDGIVIGRPEYDTLSPEAKAALADYLSVGGVVWIRLEKANSGSGKKRSSEVPPPLSDAQGFGLLLTGFRNEDEFKKATREHLCHNSDWCTADVAADRLAVTEKKKAPVWAFLTFLIAYAVGIGPVLQVVLRRMRRRLWMVWILPVSALLLCVLAFGWSYVSEGFHGTAHIRSVAMLNQKTGRVSSVGWAGFYSPLTDSGGLTFSTSMVLQPQWLNPHYDEESRSLAIDWTNGQHLTDGWLLAKTPLHFRFWKVESRREKIALRLDASGNATATNALGADVVSIRAQLPDGSWRLAERIKAGATVPLKQIKVPATAKNSHIRLFDLIDGYSCSTASGQSLENAIDFKPGMYIARVEGHPFVNTAITNPAVDKGETLVIGVFELETAAKPKK